MHLLTVSRAQFAENNLVRDLGQIINSHVEGFIPQIWINSLKEGEDYETMVSYVDAL